MPASFMVLWRSDLLLLLPVIVKLLAGSTRWDYLVPVQISRLRMNNR